LFVPFDLQHFEAQVLSLESQALKGNPLGDPSLRHNYMLVPKERPANSPTYFHLSGYFSTGYQSFQSRSFEDNIPQWIDQDTAAGLMAPALHVFVEATTYWGGSQFIDSPGCGDYGQYILNELVPEVQAQFSCEGPNIVIGGSSGGYGALHLVSVENSPFQKAIAIAPDSYFQASLLPELFKIAPQLANFSGLGEIKKAIAAGELQKKRWFFSLVNVLAMAHCYSPSSALKEDDLQLPIDVFSGKVRDEIWQEWLQKDPVHFLKKRGQALKDKTVVLDVGKYDEYSLQMGVRQIHEVLKDQGLQVQCSEFSGTHRGLTARRRVQLRDL